MRAAGSNSLLIGLFVVLAVASVALKAAAGPPKDGLGDARPGQIEDELVDRLRSEGFSTSIKEQIERSPTVFAERGKCRLSVRDARGGAAFVAVFASDAKGIGPVRYLYRGGLYSAPPTVAMRLGRLEAELRSRLLLRANAHVPVALAVSPDCGEDTFSLADVTIAT